MFFVIFEVINTLVNPALFLKIWPKLGGEGCWVLGVRLRMNSNQQHAGPNSQKNTEKLMGIPNQRIKKREMDLVGAQEWAQLKTKK